MGTAIYLTNWEVQTLKVALGFVEDGDFVFGDGGDSDKFRVLQNKLNWAV